MSASIELRHELLSWRCVDDEVIVEDRIARSFFTLNPSAAVLWEHLVRGCDHDTLVQALVDRYGLHEDEAEGDVLLFLQQLTSRGLLRLEPYAGSSAPQTVHLDLGDR